MVSYCLYYHSIYFNGNENHYTVFSFAIFLYSHILHNIYFDIKACDNTQIYLLHIFQYDFSQLNFLYLIPFLFLILILAIEETTLQLVIPKAAQLQSALILVIVIKFKEQKLIKFLIEEKIQEQMKTEIIALTMEQSLIQPCLLFLFNSASS